MLYLKYKPFEPANDQPSKSRDGSSFMRGFVNEDPDFVIKFGSDDDEEELRSSCESDLEEDDDSRARKKGKEFNPSTDMEDPIFKIGMRFPTKENLKKAMKEYRIKAHKAIKIVKNDRLRLRAKCTGNCPWIVFATVMEDGKTFIVKTLHKEHEYRLTFSNKYISSNWLAVI